MIEALTTELKVVLMSPAFLYRGILFSGEPNQQQRIDDFELAERLSYFLWADMPDAELMQLAVEATLSRDDVLSEQVDRLLDSPKSRSLAEDFAAQWLTLDDIEQVSNETNFNLAYHCGTAIKLTGTGVERGGGSYLITKVTDLVSLFGAEPGSAPG